VCTISGVGSVDSNIGDTFTYLWNFGDNTPTSTLSANSHTYAVDGTYTVTLIVTDGWGKSASATLPITITKPGTNGIPVAVIGNPVCPARTCSFFGLGSSDPNNDAITYSWNFGDASALNTTANPVKAYAADGTYTVTLIVTDAWGDASLAATRVVTISKPANVPPVPVITAPSCVGRTCSLSSAGSTDPNGDAFTYLWNFGTTPTSTSTASAPSFTFPAGGPFTVTLTLTDAWGDAASTTQTVTFTEPMNNAAPLAVIAAPACTARTCTLSAAGSSDPNGDVYTYLWNFGDGSATSTSAAPTRTYVADGNYTLTLTLTDTWGKAATVTAPLSILKPASNVAPTPVISAPSCIARACSFPGVSSFDPNGDAFTYLWNYGDASATTTAATGTRTFTTAGPFTVTLTVTDAWGDVASTTTTITLTEPGTNLAPVPVINAPSCASKVCSFSSAGSADPNGDTFTYVWAWADTTANSTTANPSHTFPVAGTFVVTLTVTDGWGKAASTTRTVTVA
jgi:PKD repeat protein